MLNYKKIVKKEVETHKVSSYKSPNSSTSNSSKTAFDNLKFCELSEEEVLHVLNTTKDGLSESEANRRLKIYGFNRLQEHRRLNALKIFISQFASPLVLLLIIASIISFFLGEDLDAIAILAIVGLNAVLGFFQEFKAEKALQALKKLSSPKTRVLRAGRELVIDAELLVPGDIILLDEGSRVPADVRLLHSEMLKAMEALLTGESVPVNKRLGVTTSNKVSEQFNMLFSGTDIVSGKAMAVVTATGMHTQLGKIAGMVESIEHVETPLQKKLGVLSKQLGIGVLVIAGFIFLLNTFLRTTSILDSFLIGVSLAIAAVPEGLPAVVTIALSLGMQRMAKRKALVRRLLSVETLGSATLICTDKTGTITKNEMTVKKLFFNDKEVDVSGVGYKPLGVFSSEPNRLLLETGVLCNNAGLELSGNDLSGSDIVTKGDPTEIALLVVAEKAGLKISGIKKQYPRVFEIPFNSNSKRMTTVHEKDHKTLLVAVKGAPEIVINDCSLMLKHKPMKMLRKEKQALLVKANEFASHALRVLGFAYKELRFESYKEMQAFIKQLESEDNKALDSLNSELVFIGLQAMIDPPREDAVKAIKLCEEAGIKVVMITGDHLSTAKAVAEQVGIVGKAIHSSQLSNIDLNKEVDNIGVYARVNPEDKLKIVQALQQKGHIVAMTGDGVNDAPALKKADIGVAVGSGTDVAKQTSDVILLNDNFATIVSAVEEGRTIFDNIKKFVGYLLFANVGEVFFLLFSTLLLFGEHVKNIPLTALQILWINLVTDSFPALALGVDPPQKDVMKRPPRNPKEHIIRADIKWLVLLNSLLLAVVGVVLFYVCEQFFDIGLTRTIVVSYIVILEALYVQTVRSLNKESLFSNKWVVLSIMGVLVLQLIAVYTPLSKVLGFTALNISQWLVIFVLSFIAYGLSVIGSKLLITIHEKNNKN